MSGYVVVGVDGSTHSLAALDWALREAADRRTEVRMVYVAPHEPGIDPVVARRRAQQALVIPVARARERAPEIPVTPSVTLGLPVDRLLAAASGAALLVVGARGLGGRGWPVPGSTARALAERAELPLAVIGRLQPRMRDRIVLGVDARHPDAAPTRFAFEAARRTRARLLAVYDGAVIQTGIQTGAGRTRADPQLVRKELQAALDRFAELWELRYPRTRLTVRTSAGMGANALIAASLGADLLVIGGRRTQGTPSRLGHIAENTLAHAACPVVIVPYPAE